MKMKDNNIDELLQAIGEEVSLEGMNEEGTHIFSDKYNEKKDQLFTELIWEENESAKELIPSKSGKRKPQWKVLLIAAAILILSSMTVFAAVKIFNVTGAKDEETGTYTYKYAVDGEQEIPTIKITANYIPQGYAECTVCGEGKYQPIENNDHKSGFSIVQSNLYNQEEIMYVSSVENTQINGIRTDILTREGVEYNHVLLMFYEEEGYVIEIFAENDISVDELKKIAENITFEVDTNAPGTQAFTEQEIDNVEALQVSKEQIVQIGTEMKDMYGFDSKGDIHQTINCTVTNLEIRDTLPSGLDETKFSLRDGEDIRAFVNDDGIIKLYERETRKWEDDKLVTETQKVGVKCIDVTLEMTNTIDENLTDVGVSPFIYFLDQVDEETYTDMPEGYVGNLTLDPFNYDRMPFYFDKTDYPNDKHFYFMGIGAGETKEVHLLYALDEDLLENSYIVFNTDNSNYIKIQE